MLLLLLLFSQTAKKKETKREKRFAVDLQSNKTALIISETAF